MLTCQTTIKSTIRTPTFRRDLTNDVKKNILNGHKLSESIEWPNRIRFSLDFYIVCDCDRDVWQWVYAPYTRYEIRNRRLGSQIFVNTSQKTLRKWSNVFWICRITKSYHIWDFRVLGVFGHLWPYYVCTISSARPQYVRISAQKTAVRLLLAALFSWIINRS